MKDHLIERLEESVKFIRARSHLKPRIGIVLGSGLGAFVNRVSTEVSFPFSEIPSFSPTTVEGHSGQLILGHLHKIPIAVLQGRVHYYEGHSMDTVVHPIRTLSLLGIEVLLLTNSAGGLNPKMRAGDLMILSDHINLMGSNPLMGPNLKQLGPRFPDMSEPYDARLIKTSVKIMKKLGISHHVGVYCGLSGPTYETPAEVRYLQKIGGDAVGMSTVPETIAANHLGLRVAGVSCISNLGSGLTGAKLSHQEVTDTAKRVEEPFCQFVDEFIGNAFLASETPVTS